MQAFWHSLQGNDCRRSELRNSAALAQLIALDTRAAVQICSIPQILDSLLGESKCECGAKYKVTATETCSERASTASVGLRANITH